MNLALRQLEEDEARGWSSVGEKWTCPDHVEDEALEALIVENTTSTTCSYCDRKEEKPFAADVDLIVERIGTSLPVEWGNADNEGVGWEGGYVHKTWDTWDLITEAIDPPLNHGDLIADVVGALPDQAWVQRDFYRLSDGDRLIFGWRDFCRIVKHKHRYFFCNYRDKKVGPFDDPDSITPGEMLAAIGEAVVEGELIRPLYVDEKLYRVRAHSSEEEPTSARDLGAPPAEYVSSSGRMNRLAYRCSMPPSTRKRPRSRRGGRILAPKLSRSPNLVGSRRCALSISLPRLSCRASSMTSGVICGRASYSFAISSRPSPSPSFTTKGSTLSTCPPRS